MPTHRYFEGERRTFDWGSRPVTTHTTRIWRAGSRILETIGPERTEEISPLASLRDAGVRFCLASDNAPVSLFYAIWQWVARTDRSTGKVIGPGQRITREGALRAATIDGAYLTFEENEKGSIEVGKLADLACLSHDPLTIDEDSIKDIRAEFTIVGGKVAYRAVHTSDSRDVQPRASQT